MPVSIRHTLHTTSELAKREASETMTLMETFIKRQAFLSGMDDTPVAEVAAALHIPTLAHSKIATMTHTIKQIQIGRAHV